MAVLRVLLWFVIWFFHCRVYSGRGDDGAAHVLCLLLGSLLCCCGLDCPDGGGPLWKADCECQHALVLQLQIMKG